MKLEIALTMTKFYRITAFFLAFLGLAHAGLTFVFYESFSVDALWFLGTGFFYFFGGLVNIVNTRTYVNSLKVFCLSSNVILLGFSAAAAILLKEPQAYAAIVICLLVLISSFFFYKNRI